MRFFTLCALLSCATALAQTPTAEQLLASYATALGGAEKLRGVQSLEMKGTMDNPDDGSKIPVEIRAKAPNRYARAIRFSDAVVYRTVFVGDAGWNADPENGVRPMNKTDVGTGRLDYDFHRAIRLSELYPKLSAPRAAKLAGKNAWSIEAATQDGATEIWYFDPSTNLLVCREFERVSLEEGILKIQEFYADYKEFDGLKFPGTIRRVMPDYELVYHFDDVKVNPAMDDAVFEKPAK